MIRDAVDAVDVYIDCMRTSSSQCVQSLVSTSRLILTGEVERRAKWEAGSVDRLAMAAFVQTTECRRGAMSRYLDGKEVRCADMDCAACDRCGEGLVDWQSSQARDADEEGQVRKLLDELADGCAVCRMLDEEDDSYLHSLVKCQKFVNLGQAGCDMFRSQIRYDKSSHTCTKCGISQKLLGLFK